MKTSSIFAALICASVSSYSGEGARKRISPSAHPMSKAVVQVSQVGVGASTFEVGNGIVVGENGCHVLTNFHVAFGKAKRLDGGTVLVDRLEAGHMVDVGVDLNERTGSFERTIKARVVEFLNYHPTELRRRKNDQVLLRLDNCLGRAYGIARIEIPGVGVHVPQTFLYTLSISKIDAKTSGLFLESECFAAADTPVAGLFFQTCESLPGMSGSPIFRQDSDGGYTVVGMSTGKLIVKNGKEVPFAIYSSAIGPFVQSVVGSGTIPGALSELRR